MPFMYAYLKYNTNNDWREYTKINLNVKIGPRDITQSNHLDHALRSLENTRTVIFNLRPGSGKTALSLFTMQKCGLLTCVLVPLKVLLKQWQSSCNKFIGGKSWIVGEKMPAKFDLIICLYTEARLKKIPENIRSKIGTLIIDECHMFANKSGIRSMLHFTPKFVIACSATFEMEHNNMHKVIEAFVGTEKITAEFDVDFTMTFVNTFITGERVPSINGQGVNYNVLIQSLLYNEIRNKMIVDLALHRFSQGKKSLIFTGECRHVKLLYDLLSEYDLAVDYLTGPKSLYNDSNVLIANVQKIGPGFDEESPLCKGWKGKRIDNAIIAYSFKQLNQIEQTFGRTFRSERPNIDYIRDKDPSMNRHASIIKKWAESKGATIETLDIVEKSSSIESNSSEGYNESSE